LRSGSSESTRRLKDNRDRTSSPPSVNLIRNLASLSTLRLKYEIFLIHPTIPIPLYLKERKDKKIEVDHGRKRRR
jgi:hypothetical protein